MPDGQTNGGMVGPHNARTSGIGRYRQHAANCLSSAQTAANASTKLALIDMAHVWVMLAEEAERNGGRLRERSAPSSAPRPGEPAAF